MVATLVLIWDIVKFFRDGARIRSNIRLNVTYPDSEVVSEENLSDGTTVKNLQNYVHLELINYGKMPTTLMDICFSSKDMIHGTGDIMTTSGTFVPHFGKTIPLVLNPGEVWSSRFKMDDFERISKYGKPEFVIRFSHLKSPLRIKAPKVANNQINPGQG